MSKIIVVFRLEYPRIRARWDTQQKVWSPEETRRKLALWQMFFWGDWHQATELGRPSVIVG